MPVQNRGSPEFPALSTRISVIFATAAAVRRGYSSARVRELQYLQTTALQQLQAPSPTCRRYLPYPLQIKLHPLILPLPRTRLRHTTNCTLSALSPPVQRLHEQILSLLEPFSSSSSNLDYSSSYLCSCILI